MRGKSGSGHSRQPSMRWCWPRRALASLIRPSILALRAASSSGVCGRVDGGAGGDDGGGVGREDHCLYSPGRGFQDHRMHAGPPRSSTFSMSSGKTFRPLGRAMTLRTRPDRMRLPRLSNASNVAGAVPAVSGLGGGGRLGVLPVAGEDGRAADQDLARLVVEADLDRRLGVADRAGGVVLDPTSRRPARTRSRRSPAGR